MKRICYLPERAANAYAHLHRLYGGPGLPDLVLVKATMTLRSFRSSNEPGRRFSTKNTMPYTTPQIRDRRKSRKDTATTRRLLGLPNKIRITRRTPRLYNRQQLLQRAHTDYQQTEKEKGTISPQKDSKLGTFLVYVEKDASHSQIIL